MQPLIASIAPFEPHQRGLSAIVQTEDMIGNYQDGQYASFAIFMVRVGVN